MTSTRCTVYPASGEPTILQLELDPPVEPPVPVHSTIADRVPLRSIMSHELVCVQPELEVPAVVSLMMKHRVGCMPVVDARRRPLGVITKLDLVEQLDATMHGGHEGFPTPQELAARTAEELMLPFPLALDEHASVAHAAAMMTSEDVHHVLVLARDGSLVGVVSSKDVVDWLAGNDRLLARRRGALS
jgi:CBS domain-containing protein